MMVNIAEKPTKLVIDIMAMNDIEQTLSIITMGQNQRNIFALMDAPYNIRELGIIIMHGINGAMRSEKLNIRISLEDANKLLSDHFAILKNTCKTPDEYVQSMKQFMIDIANVVRDGLGTPQMNYDGTVKGDENLKVEAPQT